MSTAPAAAMLAGMLVCELSERCAIVDPVLDYDPAAGRTSHASADRLIAAVRAQGLTVEWLLETHVHADHLSAAPRVWARVLPSESRSSTRLAASSSRPYRAAIQ